MAKKSFKATLNEDIDILKTAKEKHNMQLYTRTKIEEAQKNINKETLSKAVEAIKKDEIIPSQTKKQLLKQFEIKYFNIFENIPFDYSEIKTEVKFLAKMTTHSFVFLAERLKIIRDQKLYKNDGYDKFSDFIKSEIEVSQSTVDKYLNIIDLLNSAALRNLSRPSNFFPFLPLFRKIEDEKEKIRLQEKVLDIANNNTFRKAEKIARQLKIDYGLINNISPSQRIENLKRKINYLDITELEILKKYITERYETLKKQRRV